MRNKKVETTQAEILNYLSNQKSDFLKIYHIKKIGLFGSFARNEQNENSDIDIVYILEKDKKMTYFMLFELEKKLEKHFNKKIELINYQYINPIIKYKSPKDIIYV